MVDEVIENAAPVEDTTPDEAAPQEEGNVVQQPPAKVAAAPKEVAKQLRKLKLKVDGQELEEEYDPNDDEYMTRQFQLARVAQKRMQEYASLEKQAKDFIEELRKNPEELLSDPDIGIDLKKLAAKIIEKEVENSKKTPEQLKAEKLEAELKKMKDDREKEKEVAKKQEFERLKEQQYERYDMLMEKALEKTDLPKSPYVVKKMADYMLIGLQAGKDVTPEDVLPLVRSEIMDDIKEMFKVMPDEVVENIIGKDTLTRMRKKNIAKAKQAKNPATQGSNKAPDAGKKAETPAKDGKSKLTFKQFFGA